MLALLLAALSSAGASCVPWSRRPGVDSPVAFQQTPSREEVLQKVNQNTLAVRQLQADNVRLTAPGAPSLKATLALQLPDRLRIQGDFLMSREVDIGSNEEVFWFWAKSGPEAVLYARHDQYAQLAQNHRLPLDPKWLIDALGLVYFDPAARHEGPYAHGQEQLEMHSYLTSASGDSIRKVTVIHLVYGWVMEQHVYDAQGALLASAIAKNHRYYAEAGVTLPDLIEVQMAPGQPAQLMFRIDIGGYRVNSPVPLPAEQWALPQMEDYPYVDLTDPRALQQLMGAAAPPPPRQGFRPRYRGYQ